MIGTFHSLLNRFNESYISTIGIDFSIRTCRLFDDIVTLQIWDTAGQERFRTITNAYYRGSHVVIFVYDITYKKSFDDIKDFLDEACKHVNENTPKYLVGNKADLVDKREVKTETASKFAEENGFDYFIEVSAKTSFNLDKLFDDLVRIYATNLKTV